VRTLLEIVLLLVGLLIIVLFHEGGHFLAGKLVKFTKYLAVAFIVLTVVLNLNVF